MINIPIDTLKQKIVDNSNLSLDELNNKIKAKLEQLSGLISEEGAAHIIANELGINLMQTQGLLKTKDILPGMRSIEIALKVLRKYDLRTFENEKRSGKLARFLAADETGTVMVVLWNDATNNYEQIKENDILKLTDANVRDNQGKKEIHISDEGKIEINPSDVKVEVKEFSPNSENATRKKIKELTENDMNVEIFATIVQVFDPKFWNTNPETGRKIKEDDPIPEKMGYGAVLNLFADDGSDNMRVVLWKNQILELLGVDENEFSKYKSDVTLFEPIKTDLLGMMVKIAGRVQRNEMFNRLEFVANKIETDVKPEQEMNNLKQEKPAQTMSAKEPSTPPKEEEPIEDELLSLDDLEDLDS